MIPAIKGFFKKDDARKEVHAKFGFKAKSASSGSHDLKLPHYYQKFQNKFQQTKAMNEEKKVFLDLKRRKSFSSVSQQQQCQNVELSGRSFTHRGNTKCET